MRLMLCLLLGNLLMVACQTSQPKNLVGTGIGTGNPETQDEHPQEDSILPLLAGGGIGTGNPSVQKDGPAESEGESKSRGDYADLSTTYADATEIDSVKNSNGSGIQIFNLNNNKPTQDQLNDQNTGTRADLLRRERIRQELLNENRLIEKIEEDRIGTEGVRSGSIAGMQFTTGTSATSTAIAAASANDGLEEVQVSAVATASSRVRYEKRGDLEVVSVEPVTRIQPMFVQ